MFWNRIPLVRILIPFLCGISVVVFGGLQRPLPLWLLPLMLLLVIAVVVLYVTRKNYGSRWISGSLFFAMFVLMGYQIAVQHLSTSDPRYFGRFLNGEKGWFVLRLNEPAQQREKTCRITGTVMAVRDSSGWRQSSGTAMVYLEKDSAASALGYGELILVNTRFGRIDDPLNPGEFNYRRYLGMRNIHLRAYAASGEWMRTGMRGGNAIRSFAFGLREKILNLLESNGLRDREYAVAAALLIGYTDRLDADLMSDYSGSGAMHILSVSGLHVGIVFIVLSFLLSPLRRIRSGLIFRALLLLAGIWFYALLTGLSPSVMRASAMFSFIVAGQAFRQPSNAFNSMAASAVLLLTINPFYVADVGFQLSYLAVAGILALYQPIYVIWKPRWWLVDKLWALISVSVAAQLATFPLSLMYFHQFPNYFLLTNIVAVPLSGLVIYLGIAVIATSFLPAVSGFLGMLLAGSLRLLNASVSFIEGLPGSVASGIPFGLAETILLYAALASLLLFVAYKRPRFLMAGLALGILFLIPGLVRTLRNTATQRVLIYNVNGHPAIDFADGRNACFLTDSAMLSDESRVKYHIAGARTLSGIRRVFPCVPGQDSSGFPGKGLLARDPFYAFAGKRFVVLTRDYNSLKGPKVDVAVISSGANPDPAGVVRMFHPSLVVIDGGVKASRARKYQREFLRLGVPCHLTRFSGAWTCNL